MAIITLWAGTTASTPSNWTTANNKLPSPVSLDVTLEEIWDENAGRNSKGNMIATYIATKRTYTIKWGVLTSTEYSKITGLLTTGFFRFEVNTTPSTPPSSTYTFYRSEITHSRIQAGSSIYYMDVAVSVIQK